MGCKIWTTEVVDEQSDKKNSFHAQGRYIDCIDDIFLKVIEPKKGK